MNDKEQKAAGKAFVEAWKDKGYEKGESQPLFLVETGNTHLKREMEISIQAGDIVGVLYDAILKQYIDPTSEHSLRSLNMLCVRLVFCLYAEDAGIFCRKNMFHDYLSAFETKDVRRAFFCWTKIV